MAVNTVLIIIVEVPLNNAMAHIVLDHLGSTVLWGGSFVLGVISTISFLLPDPLCNAFFQSERCYYFYNLDNEFSSSENSISSLKVQ